MCVERPHPVALREWVGGGAIVEKRSWLPARSGDRNACACEMPPLRACSPEGVYMWMRKAVVTCAFGKKRRGMCVWSTLREPIRLGVCV